MNSNTPLALAMKSGLYVKQKEIKRQEKFDEEVVCFNPLKIGSVCETLSVHQWGLIGVSINGFNPLKIGSVCETV